MRLQQLQLLRYGTFTDCHIDFNALKPDFHIIYGPNEAGKSTTLRAILGLFFGIDTRSEDNFLHDYGSLRIGACLTNQAQQSLNMVRRKGLKDTLLTADEQPMDETVLATYLGGIDADQYKAMFGISYQMLIDGGAEILAGEGGLAESIFSASTGLRHIHRLRIELAKQAEMLFKERGKTPKLNQALIQFNQAKKHAEAYVQLPKIWQDKKKSKDEQEAIRASLRQQRDARLSELQKLERVKRVAPSIRQQAELMTRRHALGHVHQITSEAIDKRKSVEQTLESTRAAIHKKQAEKTQIEQHRQTLQVPDALLDKQLEIERLRQGIDNYRSHIQSIHQLEDSIRQMSAEIQALLTGIGKPETFSALELMNYDKTQLARVSRLEKESIELISELRSATELLEKQRSKQQLISQQIQMLPTSRNAMVLKSIISQARKQGDLVQQCNKQKKSLEILQLQTKTKLAALSQWQGTLSDLARLPVPEQATITRFADEYHALEMQQTELKKDQSKIAQDLKFIQKDMERISAGEVIPTVHDLIKMRQTRNACWQTVRDSWLDGKPLINITPLTLAEKFYSELVNTDKLSDSLHSDASRVAEYTLQSQQQQSLSSTLAQLNQQYQALSLRGQDLQKQWQLIWQPMGITALPPKEMAGWLVKQQALCQLAASIETAQQELHALTEEITQWRTQCLDALAALNKDTTLDHVPLDVLLDMAESVVELIEKSEIQRAELTRDLNQTEQSCQELVEKISAQQEKKGQWQQQWQQAIDELHLPNNAIPEEAAIYREALQALLNKKSQQRESEAQLARYREEKHRYEKETQAIATDIAADLKDQAADKIAMELGLRFDQGSHLRSTRQSDDKRLKEINQALAELHHDESAAQKTLDGLMTVAHCSDLDALKKLEQISKNYQELTDAIRYIETDLAREFLPLEQLIQEVNETDLSLLDNQILNLKNEIQDKDIELAHIDQNIGALGKELEQFDGRAEAAEAFNEAQHKLAEIDNYSQEYALLKLSSLILERELNRYSEQNQGPLITRASVIFKDITLDGFHAVSIALDEKDQSKLFCVRNSNDRVPVQGLSDGTRDQLYLALRLAAIEQHVTRNEPLPVVIDDALINFDDQRSQATLKIFHELAQHTQVLFFTHHAKLLELAKNVLPENTYQVHDLMALRNVN